MSKDMHRRQRRPPNEKASPSRSDDKARIVELFARREPAYRRDEVLRLTMVTEADLDCAVANGEVAAEDFAGASVFPWADVVYLALERWTPRMIQAALGHAAAEVIPYLNQHRLIRVSLPIYLIRMLDHLARGASANVRAPWNASDVIQQQLELLASTLDLDVMEAEIDGFRQALQYPSYTPRPGGAWRRCRYCDVLADERMREVCRGCADRHEPDEHLGRYGLPELEKADDV